MLVAMSSIAHWNGTHLTTNVTLVQIIVRGKIVKIMFGLYIEQYTYVYYVISVNLQALKI